MLYFHYKIFHFKNILKYSKQNEYEKIKENFWHISKLIPWNDLLISESHCVI